MRISIINYLSVYVHKKHPFDYLLTETYQRTTTVPILFICTNKRTRQKKKHFTLPRLSSPCLLAYRSIATRIRWMQVGTDRPTCQLFLIRSAVVVLFPVRLFTDNANGNYGNFFRRVFALARRTFN